MDVGIYDALNLTEFEGWHSFFVLKSSRERILGIWYYPYVITIYYQNQLKSFQIYNFLLFFFMTPWSSGKWHENRVPPLLTNNFIFHWMYDCLGLLFFKANLFFFRIRRRSTRTDHSELGGSPRESQCRGRLLIHLWLRWHLLHPESGWILFVKDSGT